MSDRARQAFEIYSEGGTIVAALQKVRMKHRDFYAALRRDPELKREYLEIQEARADMMADENYALASADKIDDPRSARVQAEVRFKLAGFYDRRRFGERVQVEMEAGPSLTAALAAARGRLALPASNLAAGALSQPIDVEATYVDVATDKQSEDARPGEIPDVFAD